MATTEHDQERPQGETNTVVHTYSSKRPYVWLWVLMLFLTAVAFVAVGMHLAPFWIIALVILFLAAVQVFMQVYLFMHLPFKRGSASRLFFMAGATLAVVFVLSTLIIVWSVG